MTQAVERTTEVAIEQPQEQVQRSTEPKLTFAEYLAYEGEPDVLYELFRGQLIPMPAQSHLHTNICKFLIYKLQRYFADKNLDLVANSLGTGVRTAENSSRIPDVVVCSQSVWSQVISRPGAGVLDFAEKPILVVEIVSSNRRDDYVIKRSEYEVAEIPEYWIVDPQKKRVRVFVNPTQEEGYSWVDFSEDSSMVSGQFDQLFLSVQELLNPPVVEQLIKEEQAKIKTLEEEAQTERQRAENERQRAETERQRAETERQRAEKLAQRLRAMGINPEEID
jgi:Uma2 family endonuclease